jgi:hypothetical protein
MQTANGVALWLKVATQWLITNNTVQTKVSPGVASNLLSAGAATAVCRRLRGGV